MLSGELIKTAQILWLFWSESSEGLWTRPDGGKVSIMIKRTPWKPWHGRELKLTEEERINRVCTLLFLLDRKGTFSNSNGSSGQRSRRENCIWNAIHHDNILQFIGYQVVKDGPPLLVSPHYKNGNLLKYIKTNPGITYAERLTLIIQS